MMNASATGWTVISAFIDQPMSLREKRSIVVATESLPGLPAVS
jgi:hypothetical protein